MRRPQFYVHHGIIWNSIAWFTDDISQNSSYRLQLRASRKLHDKWWIIMNWSVLILYNSFPSRILTNFVAVRILKTLLERRLKETSQESEWVERIIYYLVSWRVLNMEGHALPLFTSRTSATLNVLEDIRDDTATLSNTRCTFELTM